MKFPILILRALTAATLVPALHAQAPLTAQLTPVQRDAEIRELRAELLSISRRLDALVSETPGLPTDGRNTAVSNSALASEPTAAVPATAPSAGPRPPAVESADARNPEFLRDTTLGFAFDGYYGYNFNAPLGRVNLLRAYDVTSNSFNINQVNVIVEHLPTPTARMGGRIDLQFGQATESLQGSSANEQRPQVWRNLFQA
ncbi:MAG TPA: outer membrane beta-barrel protein, partial [Edaphobacter sp.]|nr:outer membrane beta-barrel protein [Edaphobacter sp.]